VAPHRVFGRRPHPRVILLGLGDRAESLQGVFPTTTKVDRLDQVHTPEWDMVVSYQGVPDDAPNELYFLCFGGEQFGFESEVRDPADPYYVARWVVRSQVTYAHHLAIPERLSGRIARLVESDLVPKAHAEEENTYITLAFSVRVTEERPASIRPFLAAETGEVLAGSFLRFGSSAECWMLPYFGDPKRWAQVAWEEWSKRDPVNFPVADWRAEPVWQTPVEREAHARLLSIDEERARVMSDLESREAEARDQLHVAQEQAASGQLRLLTEQGEELVSASEEALRTLGLATRNMDAVFPPGDRREDLRITAPDRPNWEAIAEVRGYAAGRRLQIFSERVASPTAMSAKRGANLRPFGTSSTSSRAQTRQIGPKSSRPEGMTSRYSLRPAASSLTPSPSSNLSAK
jgi:hypothetical protein